jgi:hypothetical protein
MTLQRQCHIAWVHAAAIVGYFDPADPAAAQNDVDPGRSGVDRVLHQLLQRTGRSFHHFTRGYAVHQMLGQAAY